MNIKKCIGNIIFKFQQFYVNLDLAEGSNIDSSVKLRKVHLKGLIRINGNSKLVGGVYISGNVMIDRFTSINGPNVNIHSKLNQIKIGKFCSIARNVSIQEFNHKFDNLSTFLISKNLLKSSGSEDLTSKGDVIIGNDVWIGAHSVILSGVTIGDGAVIAANTVVSKNVPAYSIFAGNPGKVIKNRFEDSLISEIKKLEWWNWSDGEIRNNIQLFQNGIDVNRLKNFKKS